MTIEVLNADEWESIPEEAMRIAEELAPSARHTMMLCARDGDEIIAVAGLQRAVYCDPFWVRKDFRGNGLSEELARMCAYLAPTHQHSLMITTNPHMERIAFKVGMTPLLGKLWARKAVTDGK